MSYKEILIFDISGEYGHFRKFNTTTSPLTYSLPTRTAIIGIIGAVLGMEREIDSGKYKEGTEPIQEKFNKANADIALQILKPTKKVNIGFNLLDTEKTASSFFNIKQRTQIEFELLKDASFRVFINIKDNIIFQELKSRIFENNHHFTPYLGLSQFTTKIDYIDFISAEIFSDNKEYVLMNSAINLSKITKPNAVQFNKSGKYSSNIMPVEMNRDRIISEFSDVLIEKDGNLINVLVNEYCTVGKYGNILFL